MNNKNILFRLQRKVNNFKKARYIRDKSRLLGYLRSEKKLIILGNQKTGSTAIAALTSMRSGQSVMLDIQDAITDVSWQLVQKYKVAQFSDFVYRYKDDFSKKIIKEPSLTFYKDDLDKIFPNSNYIFISRNPIDNIRSILNRLKIPGHLPDIEYDDWDELNMYPIWRLALDSTWLGQPRGNYIEALAYRWCVAAESYLSSPNDVFLVRYEDFKVDKVGTIDLICDQFDLPKVQDIRESQNRQYQAKGMSEIDPVEFFGIDNLEKIKTICGDTAIKFGYSL